MDETYDTIPISPWAQLAEMRRERDEWTRKFCDAALELDALNMNTGRLRVRLEQAERERDEACEGESLRAQERDAMRAERDRAIEHAHDMEADMAETRLVADLEFTRLRTLLREVEWVSEEVDIGACQVCLQQHGRGHAPDCRLAAALEGRDG